MVRVLAVGCIATNWQFRRAAACRRAARAGPSAQQGMEAASALRVTSGRVVCSPAAPPHAN
jgi:hypothetical protein